MAWFCKKPNDPKRVAICVGHSRIGDSGARSVGGVSEWAFNTIIAADLHGRLTKRGYFSEAIAHYPVGTYSQAMRWLAKHLKKGKFDIAIELHFNSFSSSIARGHEYLFYAKSKKGKELAQCFSDSHAEIMPNQTNRGIKPIDSGGRGAGFLKGVKPVAVICEPFFGSRPAEWITYWNNQDVLVDIYEKAICDYFEKL